MRLWTPGNSDQIDERDRHRPRARRHRTVGHDDRQRMPQVNVLQSVRGIFETKQRLAVGAGQRVQEVRLSASPP